METITTDAIFFIQFVRNGIQVCIIRHCLVESSIKYTYLRNIRQNSRNRVYTFQIGRIMKRSQIIASSKRIQHFLRQQYRFTELLTTMYHAVTNCIDFIQRFDCTIFRTNQCIQDELYTYSMLRYIFFQNFFFTIRQSQLQERAFQTYFFNTTLSDNLFMVHIKQFIFDRRATAVQY